MAAMTTSGKAFTTSKFELWLSQIKADWPQFSFQAANRDHWSPSSKTIFYNPKRSVYERKVSLLHELAHGLLRHKVYGSDFELLRMEAQAWAKASQLAAQYKVKISDDHIEDCLDSYRDWLHRRSLCPTCSTQSIQQNPKLYRCPNCQTSWQVTSHRFTRPYRLLKKK